MGLQYTRSESTTNNADLQTASAQDETFDIVSVRKELSGSLQNTQELDAIVSQICVNEPSTIVEFGSKAAEEISKCSDQVLRSVNMDQLNDSAELLNQLGKIMDKFDVEEIGQEKKGFLGKLFGDAKKNLENILAKYHTMGEEVDKVYVKLKQYESEIKESNKTIGTMFSTNMNYYGELVKYITAGEQGVKEIDGLIAEMTQELERTGDNAVRMDLNSLEQAKLMLEQRTQDLRIAENVAMQTIPMLKTMEFSNLNLIRKINSAFIITLPVFKQALTQAVLLKRQKIQAEAMEALDARTNEMLIKNAQNTADQSKLTMQLASGSSVKIETLEQTWNTIVSGIEETKRIQEEAKRKREEDIIRLNSLKEDFNRKMHIG